VSHDRADVIRPSRLGFAFKNAKSLDQGLIVEGTRKVPFDETWTQPWGEVKDIRNHHNELRVILVEAGEPRRRFHVVFRAYDDGVGFRYELPEQPNLTRFQIMDEETEFVMTASHRA